MGHFLSAGRKTSIGAKAAACGARCAVVVWLVPNNGREPSKLKASAFYGALVEEASKRTYWTVRDPKLFFSVFFSSAIVSELAQEPVEGAKSVVYSISEVSVLRTYIASCACFTRARELNSLIGPWPEGNLLGYWLSLWRYRHSIPRSMVVYTYVLGTYL